MTRILPPALARLLAEQPFSGPQGLVDWTAGAAKGETAVYHVGHLASDCQPAAKLDPTAIRAAQVAAALREAVERLVGCGLLTPVQKRHGEDLYEYRVTRTGKAWSQPRAGG